MTAWQGKRTIAVVAACMTAHGTPDFALSNVEITHEEYQNGFHYTLVEDRLVEAGYEEPFVHFDEMEAPAFLHAAVRQYLNVPDSPVIVASQSGEPLMPRIIEVIVSPIGETTIQTKGYSGSECQQASKWLEQALGVSTADRKTAECFEAQTTEQQVQQ